MELLASLATLPVSKGWPTVPAPLAHLLSCQLPLSPDVYHKLAAWCLTTAAACNSGGWSSKPDTSHPIYGERTPATLRRLTGYERGAEFLQKFVSCAQISDLQVWEELNEEVNTLELEAAPGVSPDEHLLPDALLATLGKREAKEERQDKKEKQEKPNEKALDPLKVHNWFVIWCFRLTFLLDRIKPSQVKGEKPKEQKECLSGTDSDSWQRPSAWIEYLQIWKRTSSLELFFRYQGDYFTHTYTNFLSSLSSQGESRGYLLPLPFTFSRTALLQCWARKIYPLAILASPVGKATQFFWHDLVYSCNQLTLWRFSRIPQKLKYGEEARALAEHEKTLLSRSDKLRALLVESLLTLNLPPAERAEQEIEAKAKAKATAPTKPDASRKEARHILKCLWEMLHDALVHPNALLVRVAWATGVNLGGWKLSEQHLKEAQKDIVFAAFATPIAKKLAGKEKIVQNPQVRAIAYPFALPWSLCLLPHEGRKKGKLRKQTPKQEIPIETEFADSDAHACFVEKFVDVKSGVKSGEETSERERESDTDEIDETEDAELWIFNCETLTQIRLLRTGPHAPLLPDISGGLGKAGCRSFLYVTFSAEEQTPDSKIETRSKDKDKDKDKNKDKQLALNFSILLTTWKTDPCYDDGEEISGGSPPTFQLANTKDWYNPGTQSQLLDELKVFSRIARRAAEKVTRKAQGQLQGWGDAFAIKHVNPLDCKEFVNEIAVGLLKLDSGSKLLKPGGKDVEITSGVDNGETESFMKQGCAEVWDGLKQYLDS